MFFTQCIHPNSNCGEKRNVDGKAVCAIALRPPNKRGTTVISNCIIKVDPNDIQKKFESIETAYEEIYSESIDIDSFSLSTKLKKLNTAIKDVRALIDKLGE